MMNKKIKEQNLLTYSQLGLVDSSRENTWSWQSSLVVSKCSWGCPSCKRRRRSSAQLSADLQRTNVITSTKTITSVWMMQTVSLQTHSLFWSITLSGGLMQTLIREPKLQMTLQLFLTWEKFQNNNLALRQPTVWHATIIN